MVFERLLARLGAVAPGRYVVKGGYALDVRFRQRARATQDLDVGVIESREVVIVDLATVAEMDLADFFVFDVARTDALDNLDSGNAIRFRVEAQLDMRRFETVRIDIGFDSLRAKAIEEVAVENVLAFAGVPPVEMALLPISQHLAEKLHAYARVYEGLRQNTRVKDLVDMVLIAELSTLQASDLIAAIESTFRSRGVRAAPERLARPPADWATTYRVLAEEVAINPRIEVGFEAASTFLNPILAGHVGLDAAWSSEHRRWLVPAPTGGLSPN